MAPHGSPRCQLVRSTAIQPDAEIWPSKYTPKPSNSLAINLYNPSVKISFPQRGTEQIVVHGIRISVVVTVDEPDLRQIGNWLQLHLQWTLCLYIAKQDQSGRAIGSHRTKYMIKAAMWVTEHQDHY